MLGTILLVGMFIGAITNAGMDTANVNQNCDMAKKTLKSMQDMRQFYDSISDQNYKDEVAIKKLIQQLEAEHTANQTQVKKYLKHHKDIEKRMHIILVISLYTIIVLFMYKSGFPQYIYNNISNRFK